ncbi:phage portal protein [Turicibacter sanguinis]|uniref:phage portal protein n=1 Tax=Turicibacter sanguinis TaxID=154288 RepID=UPI0021D51A03|nr:phage portal protein [Turicibacter sanguinis]MCU7195949.1 phage portal protein [Turicibacter sanguinis]
MLKTHSVKEELTRTEIVELVNKHNGRLPRLLKLKDMYENRNGIKGRLQSDDSKPNNKISHPYADYIVNSIVGYFMGKPVTYSFNDNQEITALFDDIYKYNDESAENTQLATDASIYGVSCELMYLDKELNPRFKAISPLEAIAIYDTSVEENLIGFIRHWKIKDVDNKDVDYVEYYNSYKVVKFTTNDNSVYEEQEHFWGDVPVVVVENNKDLCSDFEKVVDLIDALDKVVSDTANDFEMFTNAILVVTGMELEEEDYEKLKTTRVISIQDASGKAAYLFKDIPDTALENYKNRLVDDIHKFSSVPNMSDENFANNLSGVSMQFKLSSLEFKCATKESYFRKALLRRIELICNVLSLLGKLNIKTDEIIKSVDIRFTRNTINNNDELVTRALQLSTILSKETLLENLLPFIPSVEEELERLAKEKEEKLNAIKDFDLDDQGHFVNSAKALEGVEDEQDEETEE